MPGPAARAPGVYLRPDSRSFGFGFKIGPLPSLPSSCGQAGTKVLTEFRNCCAFHLLFKNACCVHLA